MHEQAEQAEHTNYTQKDPPSRFEPVTFLLWGNSADHQTTILTDNQLFFFFGLICLIHSFFQTCVDCRSLIISSDFHNGLLSPQYVFQEQIYIQYASVQHDWELHIGKKPQDFWYVKCWALCNKECISRQARGAQHNTGSVAKIN